MSQTVEDRAWKRSVAVAICWLQGLYFFVLGLWPVVHISSFQAVTGPKTDHLLTGREEDHWLVATVGLLIAVIGLALLVAAARRQISAEIILLGSMSAVVLAAIDVVYVARKTIAPIYLADAGVEFVFVLAWGVCTLITVRARK